VREVSARQPVGPPSLMIVNGSQKRGGKYG
jgi:hypothetical protein